ITRHYYTCNKQILAQLGQMYAAGGEFTKNINAAGGPGAAEFAARAIEYYCRGEET
ncbi:MAG: TipAS antibiotic-recognition domain-containing protein, partial [Gemmiger qucibialis]